jgi:hypothetical protein
MANAFVHSLTQLFSFYYLFILFYFLKNIKMLKEEDGGKMGGGIYCSKTRSHPCCRNLLFSLCPDNVEWSPLYREGNLTTWQLGNLTTWQLNEATWQ